MSSAVLEAMPVRSVKPDALRNLPAKLAAARAQLDAELELPKQFLAEVLTFPAGVRGAWQQLVRQPTELLHAARDQVVAELDQLLDIARLTAELMPEAEALNGGPLPGADRLPAARQELSRFVEMILTRWKSKEELNQLVLDTIELPEWVTKGPNPPGVGIPQSWWDAEDDDPFAPLPDDA